MAESEGEIEQRTQKALAAIHDAYASPGDEDSVTLFVTHHLEHIEADYWSRHCGVASPQPEQVLGLLGLQSHWGEDGEGITFFDFTLPEDVTSYMISVEFDESGNIVGVEMES